MTDVSRLRVYRAAAVVLAALVIVLLIPRWRSGERSAQEASAVEIVDVPARVQRLVEQYPGTADLADTFFESSAASVHLHVMGAGQVCPLHLHRKGEEVTLIVSGSAEARHVGGPGTQSTIVEAGTLVDSPAGCAHSMTNRSKDSVLANLVFSAPPFDGNWYVQPEDRGLACPVGGDFAIVAVSESRDRAEVPPLMQGRMSVADVVDRLDLPGNANSDLILYVLEGAGTLVAASEHPLRVGQLAMLRRAPSATVRANPGTNLVVLVFRP
jgi:mannose-6-phosphate isomerase-like protein (cupin superfamily)